MIEIIMGFLNNIVIFIQVMVYVNKMIDNNANNKYDNYDLSFMEN